jgi:hypothetical protein
MEDDMPTYEETVRELVEKFNAFAIDGEDFRHVELEGPGTELELDLERLRDDAVRVELHGTWGSYDDTVTNDGFESIEEVMGILLGDVLSANERMGGYIPGMARREFRPLG